MWGGRGTFKHVTLADRVLARVAAVASHVEHERAQLGMDGRRTSEMVKGGGDVVRGGEMW